jgi:hypothetical protein
MQRTAHCSDASPPRNCSHKSVPFVEAAPKAKLAGGIETQPGVHLAALSAFSIVDGPIIAARNKDVGRERVVFGFHCRKLGLDITYGHSESFQNVLKARRPHTVQLNIIDCGASSLYARQPTWPFVPPDARPKLQAPTPRGKETRPSNPVLRERRNEVPKTAEGRAVKRILARSWVPLPDRCTEFSGPESVVLVKLLGSKNNELG